MGYYSVSVTVKSEYSAVVETEADSEKEAMNNAYNQMIKHVNADQLQLNAKVQVDYCRYEGE